MQYMHISKITVQLCVLCMRLALQAKILEINFLVSLALTEYTYV